MRNKFKLVGKLWMVNKNICDYPIFPFSSMNEFGSFNGCGYYRGGVCEVEGWGGAII